MWCCYVVDRPPVKFHRVQSLFDSPTINYSDNIVGQNIGRFRSPETVVGSLSSLLLARALLHSPQVSTDLSRASESCPEPDPDCRHLCV